MDQTHTMFVCPPNLFVATNPIVIMVKIFFISTLNASSQTMCTTQAVPLRSLLAFYHQNLYQLFKLSCSLISLFFIIINRQQRLIVIKANLMFKFKSRFVAIELHKLLPSYLLRQKVATEASLSHC